MRYVLAFLAALALLAIALAWTFVPAHAESKSEWFKALRMPDRPSMSCCDVSDCREDPDARFDPSQGLWIANLTDRRKTPNAAPNFTPVPPGKIVRDTASWEGKAYICSNGATIYCFVPPGGGT